MELKPGYKLTEVGAIPDGWNCLPIEKVMSDISMGPFGSDIKVEYFQPQGIPVLNGFNVKDIILNDRIVNFVTPQKAAALKKAVAYRGDIVITHRGTIGQVSVIPFDSKFKQYVISQSQFRVTLNRNKANPLYVVYFFHTTKGQNALLEKKGYTGVPALAQPTTNFRKLYIPLPILSEQTAIATVLSDMDALLDSLDRLIAKKRDIKQAALQELLTGKTRLPGFDGEWEVKRLGDVATLKARIGWQGLTTAEYLSSGEHYLVTGTEFDGGYIDWSKCCFVDDKRYRMDRYIQLKVRDVLVTKDGTIGKVALVSKLPGSATLNSGVFVIRPINDAFSPEFFYYILCSSFFSDFLGQLAAGSTINHLYQKDFVNFSFCAPPSLAEQTAIAKVLSDMDAEIEALEERRTKTQNIKQGMMQELLTGKTRLIAQEG